MRALNRFFKGTVLKGKALWAAPIAMVLFAWGCSAVSDKSDESSNYGQQAADSIFCMNNPLFCQACMNNLNCMANYCQMNPSFFGDSSLCAGFNMTQMNTSSSGNVCTMTNPNGDCQQPSTSSSGSGGSGQGGSSSGNGGSSSGNGGNSSGNGGSSSGNGGNSSGNGGSDSSGNGGSSGSGYQDSTQDQSYQDSSYQDSGSQDSGQGYDRPPHNYRVFKKHTHHAK